MEQRRLTGRQITTMVVALCVAAVLAPVGAIAATGQLVNITDPQDASRKARVENGALRTSATVPARPHWWSARLDGIDTNGYFRLHPASRERFALTSVTLTNPEKMNEVDINIVHSRIPQNLFCPEEPPAGVDRTTVLRRIVAAPLTTTNVALPTPLVVRGGCLYLFNESVAVGHATVVGYE